MHPPPFDLNSLYRNLFGSSKAGVGRAAPKLRKQSAAEDSVEPAPEETTRDEEAAQPASEKAKVVLKNLAWGVEKARFNDQVTLRLEADVPASLANLTRIQIEVVALLPDGGRETLDRKEIHLKDGRASGEVTVFYPQTRDEDGNLLESCDLVFTASHRGSEKAESPKLPVKQPLITNVRWEKAEEWFGAPVRLTATTCLRDGEEVVVKVASENGLALDTKARAKKGRLEVTWTPCLCGVAAGEDGKYPEKVEFYAEVSRGEEKAQPEKNFFLKVVAETGFQLFSKAMTWGKYGVHAEFKQRIKNGIADVRVPRNFMKAWAGILLDMTDAGFEGIVAGCPFARRRWGRIVGRGRLPNQYHDGKRWQMMPEWFVPMDDDVVFLGFIRKGDQFVLGDCPSAVWPDKFPDYDFHRPDFVEKRKAWNADTESRWSRKFRLRPANCAHGAASGGCGYPLDLALDWEEAKEWKPRTVAICKGNFRSNTSCFALGCEPGSMVAHEVGHYVGMPDEYEGGALVPTLHGDGAVNGIDTSSIMGNSLNLVKKRHYANFARLAEALVSNPTGGRRAFVPSEE